MTKIIIVTIFSILLFITGCSDLVQNAADNNSTITQTDSVTDTPSTDSTKETDNSTKDSMITPVQLKPTIDDKITDIINNLTIEEKVAQLFILDFYGMTGTYQSKEFTPEIQDFLGTYNIGGVIYFAKNIESMDQLTAFNNQLQVNAQMPLFISIDEEGGLVSRLGAAKIGVDRLPSANTLASSFTVEEVYEQAVTLGKQIQSAGFNYNFAPVLDVNTNPNNPVIGNRSFGNTKDIVAEYGSAFSKGLNDAGILSSGKHFPGHGDTETDSHLGLASITHDINRLREVELVPFIEAISNGISSIMIGHITTTNIDNEFPASLSPYFITDLLRGEMGFEGLVISDSFRMQAITDFYPPELIGVQFLKAGGDIILIPSDFETTYNGILKAIEEGELKVDRIDESVKRILMAKYEYQILTDNDK